MSINTSAEIARLQRERESLPRSAWITRARITIKIRAKRQIIRLLKEVVNGVFV